MYLSGGNNAKCTLSGGNYAKFTFSWVIKQSVFIWGNKAKCSLCVGNFSMCVWSEKLGKVYFAPKFGQRPLTATNTFNPKSGLSEELNETLTSVCCWGLISSLKNTFLPFFFNKVKENISLNI